jgi:hypothetical protein
MNEANNALLMKIISIAFAAWAGVVAYGVRSIITQIDTIHTESVAAAIKTSDYMVGIERRIAALEEYQKVQDSKREKIADDVDTLMRDHLDTLRRQSGIR